MKFTVNIEERINQEFEIEAETFEQALDIAEEKYKSGELVLDDAYLSAKQIAIVEPSGYATEWHEF